MSGYHRLPPTIIESMCGGGDHAERDVLRAGQTSKRLAQLRALVDEVARGEHGRVAAVDESYDALAAVQRHAPGVVADLLSGPQVGAWAAWCLRLGHDGEVSRHLAHLGSVAVAAALRAGVEVKVRIPNWSGVVAIPSVGHAVLTRADHGPLVECHAGPEGVVLDGDPPAAWTPVRSLRAEAGGVVLDVQLDELDPYWRVFGLSVLDRLSDEEVARWQECLASMWRILAERHSHRLDTMAAAVRCLVPVGQAGRLGRVSASSADAPGAVALSEPATPARLAATLVHESQHYRLNALQDLRPLFREPARNLLYSPWRNDPRPLPGVVHGMQAFLGVADFWRRERSDPAAGLEYTRHVCQLRVAASVVACADDLTGFGRALVDSLSAAIDRLPDLDTETRRIADDLVAEHEATWRLRNVEPSEHAVRTFAREWRDCGPPRTTEEDSDTVRPAEPSGDHPLTRLAMAWLDDPAKVRVLAEDAAAFAARFPGTDPADVHLLGGDYRTAQQVALSRVEAGTANDHDWALLTVAHGRLCAEPMRSPLVRQPELVRAAVASDALAALLTDYEAGTSTSDSMRR